MFTKLESWSSEGVCNRERCLLFRASESPSAMVVCRLCLDYLHRSNTEVRCCCRKCLKAFMLDHVRGLLPRVWAALVTYWSSGEGILFGFYEPRVSRQWHLRWHRNCPRRTSTVEHALDNFSRSFKHLVHTGPGISCVLGWPTVLNNRQWHSPRYQHSVVSCYHRFWRNRFDNVYL